MSRAAALRRARREDPARFRSYEQRRDKTARAKAARDHYRRHRGQALEQKRRRHSAHPEIQREKNLRDKFRITLKQYQEALAAQGGVCASCGRPERARRRDKLKALAVDHDHATNKRRELLCHACNCALGLLGDDPVLIEKLLAYRLRHMPVVIT